MVDVVYPADQLPVQQVKSGQLFPELRRIMFFHILLPDLFCGDISIFDRAAVSVKVDVVKVKQRMSPAVDADDITFHTGALGIPDVTDDVMDLFAGKKALSHKFAHAVTFGGEGQAGNVFEERICRQVRVEIVGSDFGFDFKSVPGGEQCGSGDDLLIIFGNRTERTQNKTFVALFQFNSKRFGNKFYHLFRRINFRHGVVYSGCRPVPGRRKKPGRLCRR